MLDNAIIYEQVEMSWHNKKLPRYIESKYWILLAEYDLLYVKL